MLLPLFGQTNSIVFLVLAIVFALVTLGRRNRPLTRSRFVDVSLSAGIFTMVGMRYGLLAAVALAAPQSLFGAEADPAFIVPAACIYAAASALGFLTYRGSVGWRTVAVALFAAVSLVEVVMTVFVLEMPLVDRFGAGLALAVALVSLALAAIHWIDRTATPNPLASKEQRIDY